MFYLFCFSQTNYPWLQRIQANQSTETNQLKSMEIKLDKNYKNTKTSYTTNNTIISDWITENILYEDEMKEKYVAISSIKNQLKS